MKLSEADSLIESFRQILNVPTLEIVLNPHFGSAHSDHRALLRAALEQKAQAEGTGLHEILNLDQTPLRFGKKYLSISHAETLGGFLTAPTPCGFDLEQASRVQERAARRVSTEHEFRAAPSPAFLWAAKESAFKALAHFQQPSVMSQIETGKWEKLDFFSRAETFQLINAQEFAAPQGMGCVIHEKEFIFAVTLLPT